MNFPYCNYQRYPLRPFTMVGGWCVWAQTTQLWAQCWSWVRPTVSHLTRTSQCRSRRRGAWPRWYTLEIWPSRQSSALLVRIQQNAMKWLFKGFFFFLLRKAKSDLVGPNSDTTLIIRRINTFASSVVVNYTTAYFIRGSHSTPFRQITAVQWHPCMMCLHIAGGFHSCDILMFMWHFCHITSVTTAGQLMSERWLY